MLLRNIPLFATLGDSELAQITAEASMRQFPKNKVIMSEGEKSDSLYTIVAGKVKVLISDDEGKEIILSMLGPGEFFGEMALFDNEPRLGNRHYDGAVHLQRNSKEISCAAWPVTRRSPRHCCKRWHDVCARPTERSAASH
jgi:CRP-like cAMP-binding protein